MGVWRVNKVLLVVIMWVLFWSAVVMVFWDVVVLFINLIMMLGWFRMIFCYEWLSIFVGSGFS